MKTIGIKLADGTFYPILEEGEPKSRKLDVTTVKDNQTKVQIDLYRSETGTMADAEYVDTLEVTKLNPHPNGEPNLHLSVSLDENNELKAEVIDAETGAKSETQIQLVSRTLAERESTDVDFALPETAINESELAALEAQNEPEKADNFLTEDFSFDDLTDDTFALDSAKKAEEESAALAAAASLDDISLDLPSFDDFDAPVSKSVAPTEDTTFAGDAADTKTDDLFDIPDFHLDEPTETAAPKADDLSFDLPDIDANLTTTEFDAAVTEATAQAETASSNEISLDLPDFDDTEFDTALDTPTKSIEPANESEVAETKFDDFSMDLPDFDDTEFDTALNTPTKSTEPATNELTTTESSANESSLDEMSFDMPDFDDIPVADSAEPTGISGLFDDPIFKSDDFTAQDTAPATSSAMDFSDLYDDETLAGEHSTPYEDEGEVVKKKTRVPVIICVVCAIICIIATLLILFIIPSKYNLIKSRNTKHTVEQTDESGWVRPKAEIKMNEQDITLDVRPAAPAKPEKSETLSKPKPAPAPAPSKEPEKPAPLSKPKPAPTPVPIEEPEPNVPSVVITDAQEDRIVVAPTPTIVPVPAEKPKEKKDVRYRIKWGDTLWDISESYYKNPWKYPKIAQYNKIKNPDLIISGTDILIPED